MTGSFHPFASWCAGALTSRRSKYLAGQAETRGWTLSNWLDGQALLLMFADALGEKSGLVKVSRCYMQQDLVCLACAKNDK